MVQVKEKFIPLCIPLMQGNEWKYIKECLDTNWVSSVGAFVDRFESELSSYVGTQYAVATMNGTAALHIALLVAGVQPNDEVLVSTLSFIAPANAIRYSGAWPVFMDAEANYWQMDANKVANFLERECHWKQNALFNKTTGRRVRAILPVHILGHPCDMEPIVNVARKYNLAVVEDATESLGAKYKGKKVGALGDIACFSFNGNKIITTGGGGMIVTDNEAWARKAKYLTTQAKDDPVEYIHKEIGYNYRLTNIQAAMGCAQMEKLGEAIDAKRNIACHYKEMISNIRGLNPMNEATWAFSTYWLYTVLVDEKEFGKDSRALIKDLRALGIESRPLWQPLHLSTAHQGAFLSDCSVAESIAKKSISLPSSVGLSTADQKVVLGLLASL